MTADIYAKVYGKISSALLGKENEPLCYDDVEIMLYKDVDSIWPTRHKLSQYARLAYEVLYALHREGKLKTITRAQNGRDRYFMYI